MSFNVDEANKKIQESPNPFVEYIIQNFIYNLHANGGGAAAPASAQNSKAGGANAAANKTPAPAAAAPAKKKSSSVEEPITGIFGDDDGW